LAQGGVGVDRSVYTEGLVSEAAVVWLQERRTANKGGVLSYKGFEACRVYIRESTGLHH